ncbi:MAG: NnrS family protein [Burkholderiales bacterium]|nr:NnrS family protein [Burkholderiales bacterium]
MGNFALWNLGFRPFYLLASLFGLATILLWVAQLSGLLENAYLQGPLWHGHEMLFGYTLAVVAGFLLTAVRAWTGQPTPVGIPLMVLSSLWLAGRVLVLTPYGGLAAVVNAAFPAALALAIALPLWHARNARNYFFVGLLLLMAALVAALHLTLLDVLVLPPRVSLVLGLDVMLFIMAVIGGRVIPMFTNKGVPGAGATRQLWIERLALASVLILFAADLLQPDAALVAAIALVATLAHGLRLLLWRPWRTLSTPLVWILHAAYSWIVLYLALRALAAVGWVAETHAIHALTVGAIGGMTLGMMTRTARGHTGRPLRADGFELACFLLIQVSALLRVFGAMLPSWYLTSIQASGLLWAAAFGIYVLRYWPILTQPRLDGKPG